MSEICPELRKQQEEALQKGLQKAAEKGLFAAASKDPFMLCMMPGFGDFTIEPKPMTDRIEIPPIQWQGQEVDLLEYLQMAHEYRTELLFMNGLYELPKPDDMLQALAKQEGWE